MYKKLIWIAVFSFSIMLGQAAFANACEGGLKKMVESLKLDNSQREKIKPILEQLKSSIQTNMEQMKDLRDKIREQELSANMDQNSVDGLIDQKSKLIAEVMKAKVKATNQIYNILNENQKSELKSMKMKLEEKMAEKYKKCHEEE